MPYQLAEASVLLFVTCFVSQIKNNICKVPETPWVAVVVQSLNRAGLSATP